MGASWTDNIDGTGDTIDTTFTQTGSVNLAVPGVYTITYTKTDASSNTGSATRTITVVDTTAPTLTLIGANPISLTQGTPYTDS